MLTKAQVNKLHQILGDYRQDFRSWWKEAKYRWEAVKIFRDRWNPDVPPSGFSAMLQGSLYETDRLLPGESFPVETLVTYAEIVPEKFQSNFRYLFDESHEYDLRISEFKERMDYLYKMHGAKSHLSAFKDAFSVASYFTWLRYPDSNYMYSRDVANNVLEALGVKERFGERFSEKNVKMFVTLCDEICEYIKEDYDLLIAFGKVHSDEDYPDTERKILTTDLGYYITEKYFVKQYDFGAAEDEPEPAVKAEALGSSGSPADGKEGKNAEDADEETSEAEDGYLFETVAPSSSEEGLPTYTRDDFLNEVFLAENQYRDLVELLSDKKNVILQGVPGVGKTFAAERLAYSVMRVKDESRVRMVQFHQNYSYEDFIMGYKPFDDGFRLVDGVFYKFCKQAEADPERRYFFIIDEINRGNMSKIFGEMFMYIESGYRGKNITFAGDDRSFCVPENLYIIGTMNTADKSLSLIDYALRRRFSFFEIPPGFGTKGFKKYQSGLRDSGAFTKVIEQIVKLNEEISADESLGKDYQIGHSYFSNLTDCSARKLRLIIQYDIMPLLREYWIDNPAQYDKWDKRLKKAINQNI